MKPKEEALKECLGKGSQVRQIRTVIKLHLIQNKNALTVEEVHLLLQEKSYKASFRSTKSALWRMAQAGEVLVSVSKPRHYFII